MKLANFHPINSLDKNTEYLFNKNEIVIAGYSNSGKTTLISNLISYFSPRFKVGYYKHDAHTFTMDKKGKDTNKAWESGAETICINDSDHWAILSHSPLDLLVKSKIFHDLDLVFIEGCKDSLLSKIIMLDDNKKIIKEVNNNRFRNIIALVGEKNMLKAIKCSIPKFERNDIEAIALFLKSFLNLDQFSSCNTVYTCNSL